MLSPSQIAQLKAGMNIPSSPVSGIPSRTAPATHDWVDSLSAENSNKDTDSEPSIGSRMSSDIKEAGSNINDALSGQGEFQDQSAIRRGTGAVAEAASGVSNVAEEALPQFARTGLNEVGKAATGVVNWLGDKLGSTKLAQDFVTKHPDAAKFLEESAGTAANLGGTAGNILGAEGGAKVATKIADKAPGAVTALDNKLGAAGESLKGKFAPTQEKIDQYVANKFDRAVKPTIKGKGTLAKADDYRDDAVSAVKTITQNKANLSYENEGGVETGRLPKSLKEFAEANDQTKENIFKQYDTLSKQAGDQGAKVDVTPISNELDTVIGNKALSITNPEAITYAKSLKERLGAVGEIDPDTAQTVIKNYNKSLDAFYRNPSYESATKAAIDAGVANSFRKSLDSSIEGATGGQYQALKNQYGQLKSIENDVNKAALRDARKNVKGLLDYSDIFTGGQMVGGILSLNPAMFVKGAAERSIKEYVKYLNDPNRAISKMFSKVDQ